MRVLVSGATGLVGRYIVEEFLAAGYKVSVGARMWPKPGLFDGAVDFRPLSLDWRVDHLAAFDGIDAFIHAAFHHVAGKYRGGEGDNPELFRACNLDGSVALFEAARRAGVRRCVFLSSRAVYDGLVAGQALTEDRALAPTSLYGEVKLVAERALADLTTADFIGASLRLTGIYGDLRPNKWDGMIAAYLAGRPVAPRAGSEVHGRDAAQAMRLVLEAPGDLVAGRAFNVSDIVTDNRDVLTVVQAETGCPHPLPEPGDRASVAVMATDRLDALGWRPGGLPLLEKTVRQLASGCLRPPLKTSRVVRSNPGPAFLRRGRLRRQRL